ncbi:MAG: response regulator [Bryobacteraceae bacterium]
MTTANHMSIVVVEDNPDDVFLIKEALSAECLDVDLRVLENGEEAIRMISDLNQDVHQPCPSLMLLDVNLPRADGFEVLRRLRESKRCACIPVIVMTSSAALADREKSGRLGACAYFEKPSQYEEFLEIGKIVKRHLSGS